MSAETREPNAERIESILRTSAFFRATSTRRRFMQHILATGGGVALSGVVGAAVLGCDSTSPRGAAAAVTGPTRATASPAGDVVRTASDPDPVTAFGNAAVGAERIGIAFYNNALGNGSPFGVPSDLAKGTLLNSARDQQFHRGDGGPDRRHRV